jgi:hypothetical protein
MQTSWNVEIKHLSNGGMYSHIGVIKYLNEHFLAEPSDPCFTEDTLRIQINIDGLPVSKSTSSQLWPILGILKGSKLEKPFTIGVYAGSQKPSNLDEFLADFVEELKGLQTDGVVLGNHTYYVAVHSFVCDAPARAMLKQIKLHSGYNACERCSQKGEWCSKVIYRNTDAPLRSDVLFDELADPSHHHRPSPLRELNVGMVTQFCLDYMHLVCLGIVRKLILLWLRGPLLCRLSANMLQQVSERLTNLRTSVPLEFARKPRTVYDVDRWKATEFRQFLLYTGPVVLKGILTEAMYQHFMLLSFSIYCCLNSDLCHHYSEFVRALLLKFVNLAGDIYGKEVLVYNMHSVIHIVDDVHLFGALDSISCFPFENHLRCMKRLLRRPGVPLQQVVRRMAEIDA